MVKVRKYKRRDGTKVRSHTRSDVESDMKFKAGDKVKKKSGSKKKDSGLKDIAKKDGAPAGWSVFDGTDDDFAWVQDKDGAITVRVGSELLELGSFKYGVELNESYEEVDSLLLYGSDNLKDAKSWALAFMKKYPEVTIFDARGILKGKLPEDRKPVVDAKFKIGDEVTDDDFLGNGVGEVKTIRNSKNGIVYGVMFTNSSGWVINDILEKNLRLADGDNAGYDAWYKEQERDLLNDFVFSDDYNDEWIDFAKDSGEEGFYQDGEFDVAILGDSLFVDDFTRDLALDFIDGDADRKEEWVAFTKKKYAERGK